MVPFELEDPPASSPVVVAVPHAGLAVPDLDRPLVKSDARQREDDADLLVDALYARAPERGAARLVATVSRHVIDLNRALHDVETAVCPALAHPLATPRSLIWRLATDDTSVLPRALSPDEVRSRIERIHQPYHAALRALLEERRKRFGHAVLLDAHSTRAWPGVAEVVISDVLGTTCAESLSRLCARHLAGCGFEVACNKPFVGGFSVRRYGLPEEGLHALQIEVRRDLYLVDGEPRLDAPRAERLSRALEVLVGILAANGS